MGCRIMSIQLNYEKGPYLLAKFFKKIKQKSKKSIFSKFKMAAKGT